MQPDNHFAPAFARGLHHRLAFVNCMADGLLHIDMGAGFHGVDRWQGVPVIGGGDNGDIGTFLLQQFPIISILARLIGTDLANLRLGHGDLRGIGIGKSHGGTLAGGEGFAKNIHAPPAGADERGLVLAAGRLGQERDRA